MGPQRAGPNARAAWELRPHRVYGRNRPKPGHQTQESGRSRIQSAAHVSLPRPRPDGFQGPGQINFHRRPSRILLLRLKHQRSLETEQFCFHISGGRMGLEPRGAWGAAAQEGRRASAIFYAGGQLRLPEQLSENHTWKASRKVAWTFSQKVFKTSSRNTSRNASRKA